MSSPQAPKASRSQKTTDLTSQAQWTTLASVTSIIILANILLISGVDEPSARTLTVLGMGLLLSNLLWLILKSINTTRREP